MLKTGMDMICGISYIWYEKRLFLSARTAMWSMPVVVTEWNNENDSANQNYVAKMTL